MLDFADVVAINKFERRGAKDALRDVGRQLVRNREAFGQKPDDMPVFGTSAATFNDDGVTALYHHVAGMLREDGSAWRTASCRSSTRRSPPASPRSCRRSGCATSPRSPRPSATTTPKPSGSPSRPVASSGSRRGGRGARRARRGGSPARGGAPGPPRRRRRADRGLAGRRRVVLRRRAGRHRPRPGDPHEAAARVAVRHQGPARQPAAHHRPRRARLVTAAREPARLLPVHRRRLPVQARHRGRGAHVRRRGRPVPHEPPVQAALRGRRGQPAVDRVRLRDALRPRPRPAPRRLRQGRHVRRLGGDARRHEGALRRLRPLVAVDVGVDDDQRAGPHRARVLPQHRDRPGRRALPRRARTASRTTTSAPSCARSRCGPCAAPCRPTSSRRTRARTPACSPPSSACG